MISTLFTEHVTIVQLVMLILIYQRKHYRNVNVIYQVSKYISQVKLKKKLNCVNFIKNIFCNLMISYDLVDL